MIPRKILPLHLSSGMDLFAGNRAQANVCIISHPDARKTTLTEKLPIFRRCHSCSWGWSNQTKIRKTATSRFYGKSTPERGISVATSVMGFEYKGYKNQYP
jgi:peptide chain release factor 3